jgi:dephospho-CoA kinase
MAYAIGLTGGIGSGKSRVAELFRELGATIVDTDELSRLLTGPGAAGAIAIGQEFGADYLTAEGALDRDRMRERVFADPDARRQLEAILHPQIRREVGAALAGVATPYAVVVVPLLVETGAYRDAIQRVVVVDCSEELQVARVTARSGLAEDEVRAIMASQASRAERLRHADDIIRNEGDVENLRAQVRALHQSYLAAAAGGGAKPPKAP